MSDTAVTDNFQAARAQAPLDDAWMKDLASTPQGAGAGQPASPPPAASGENGKVGGASDAGSSAAPSGTTPASPPAGPAKSAMDTPLWPSDPNLPFGLKVENAAKVFGQRVGEGVMGMVPQWAGGTAPTVEQINAARQHLVDQAMARFKDQQGRDPTDDERLRVEFNDPTLQRFDIDQAMGIALGAAGGGVGRAALGAKIGEVAEEGAAAAKGASAAEMETAPGEVAVGVAAKPGAALESESAAEPKTAPDITIGGKPLDPVNVTPEVKAQAAKYLNGEIAARSEADGGVEGATPGALAENPVKVSLDTVSRDPLLVDTIKRVAATLEPGAVKHDDVLKMGAYALQMSDEEIASGPVGMLPNDEQVGAWKMTLDAMGAELRQRAATAIETNKPEDWDAFARGYALVNRSVGAYSDARSELGRSLRAGQVQFDERPGLADQVRGIIDNVGPNNVEAAARGIAGLPDPAQAIPQVSVWRRMANRDGLLFGYYNVLLSNPATVVKKVASDASLGLWNVASTGAAELLGRAGLNSGHVVPGETAALVTGYLGAAGDAFRAAGKALRAGNGQFDPTATAIDGSMRTRISMLAAGHDPGAPATPVQSGWSYLKAALPTSWIGAADDFGKVVNFRAEARRLAYREAIGIHGSAASASGPDGLTQDTAPGRPALSDLISQHVNDTLNAMPDHIAQPAMAQARINTLTEPLDGIAQKLADAVDDFNIGPRSGFQIPLGRLVLPFMRIGANVMNVAYRNSPLPLVPWLRSQNMSAQMIPGTASRDLAMARIGLGSAAIGAGLGYVIAGGVTGGGPKDPAARAAWERAGNRPYSITPPWGGAAVSYRGVEPIGFMLGALADTVDTMKFAVDHDAEQAASSAVLGVGNALLSAQYLSGFAGFLDALNQPQTDGARWARQFIAGMTVPAGVSATERATDQWQRAHYNLLDTIAARTPGLSKDLPGVQNLWGEDIKLDDAFVPFLSDSGMARAVSPWKMGPAPADVAPIDKWIWDNRAAFPENLQGRYDLPSKPSRTLQMSNNGLDAQVQLDPVQYHRYLELAGNGIAMPRSGVGLKDTLNALVTGQGESALQAQWNKSSPSAQALMVTQLTQMARAAAKQQLRREDTRIDTAVRAQFAARASALSSGAATSASAPFSPGPQSASAPQPSSGGGLTQDLGTRRPALRGAPSGAAPSLE